MSLRLYHCALFQRLWSGHSHTAALICPYRPVPMGSPGHASDSKHQHVKSDDVKGCFPFFLIILPLVVL